MELRGQFIEIMQGGYYTRITPWNNQRCGGNQLPREAMENNEAVAKFTAVTLDD